jgi:hypothetical protein
MEAEILVGSPSTTHISHTLVCYFVHFAPILSQNLLTCHSFYCTQTMSITCILIFAQATILFMVCCSALKTSKLQLTLLDVLDKKGYLPDIYLFCHKKCIHWHHNQPAYPYQDVSSVLFCSKLAQLKYTHLLLFCECHVDSWCDIQVFPLIIFQSFEPTRVVAILR